MSKKTELNELYFRFLRLKQSVEGMTRARALDAIEERLLTYVAMAALKGDAPQVTDLMQLSEIASPATLHKRLGNLEKRGFVKIKPVPNAYPRKAVTLSSKAVNYFNALSEGLAKLR